jgi:general secretion pathway protein N
VKARAWLAAGVGLYAIALAALAPARLLDARLDAASGGRLRLVSTEGTLWSGHATAELRDDAGRRRWAAPLGWRLRPAALLAGRLDYRLATVPGASLASLSLSRSRVEMTGLDLALPAKAMAAAIPDLAPWGVDGELRLVSNQLGFGPGHASGKFTLQWRSAGSALAPVAPLGDYALEAEARDAGWHARLHTIAGPLQLSGEGAWRPGHPADFEAIARVPPALAPELSPFLRLVAVERGDGSFAWRLR